ncbi:MAG TPA: SDR family NAD(P)-dependent oxidoreductase [Nannocystaceae bacterium]|nr:SDR family NAD(P)-dependent oxidoreductase [Nannocystaceae bacterium]
MPPDHGETSYVGSAKLVDKVALVHGGDHGIGRAVAIAFAREGADVAIGCLDEDDDARTTATHVQQAGRRALLLPGDVRNVAHCEALVRRTIDELGKLDILVLNGARRREAAFTELTAEQVERTFQTNVIAPIHLVQAAVPHLKSGASILITGSVTALAGDPRLVDYACSKAAMHNLTLSLSKALAQQGVRVNCVAPGPSFAQSAASYVFLASADASFYTGEVLTPAASR